MNLDHDFVQVSKLSEDQKKRSSSKMQHSFPQIQVKTKKKNLHQKWNTFFPRIQVDTYALMHTRGGFEDTRLEAKAKDTKKSEAKAKDSRSEDRPSRGQGPRTQLEVFSKKKGLQKSFSGDLQFLRVLRIFDWRKPKPQITCYDVIKIFQKRKFLRDKDIVGWKI